MSRGGDGLVTLAVCGSNLTGDAPFSAALRLADGAAHAAVAPAGARADLAALCRDLCAAHGVAPAAVRRVLVDVGPGSYTGLRVAVTFARFLQRFGEVDVLAVHSLALLAHHGRSAGGGPLRPMLDARRGRYHTALYQLDDGRLVEREPQQAVGVDDALARVRPGQRVVAPATFAAQIGDAVRAAGAECVAASGLTAAALLDTDALPLFAAAAEDLEPRYLMASYAED